MSDQILIFLIDTIIGLFSLALLMRFYFQLLRVPYYNQLSRFLIAVTDFIVRPARRFIPGWGGIDLSTLILAWLAQYIIVASIFMLQDHNFDENIIGVAGIMGLLALVEIVKMTLYIILVMIIVQAILSWVNPQSPLAPLLDSFTRPFLGFFRKRIPPIASIDLSPLFALIIIQLLLMVVAGAQMEIYARL